MEIRISRGGGLLGTGRMLLGVRTPAPGTWVARPWLCVLFLPLVPLAPLEIRAAGEGEGPLPAGVPLDARLAAEPPGLGATLWRAAAGLLLVAGCLAAMQALADRSSLVGTAGVVLSGAVPVVLLSYLDLTVPRLRLLGGGQRGSGSG